MTDLVVRPLVAGEEKLFDSMPDPLPQLRQISYADGIAGGGYRPEHTFVALRGDRVVGRAAWLLLPGSVGEPWLERFDLDLKPFAGAARPADAAGSVDTASEIGAVLLRAAHDALGGPKVYPAGVLASAARGAGVAEATMAAARLAGLVERGERIRFSWAGGPLPAPSGRFSFRSAQDAAEIGALVARIGEPVVLTGAETARVVAGVDLARDPLAWLTGTPLGNWRVALHGDEPVGLAGPTADACFPMIAYLGLLDESVLGELLADAVAALAGGGAYEVVADVDAHRVAVVAELERTGFRRIRSRVVFTPA
ncbi:acetyltransferase [Verrucosispora sioxanthis]|uniref:acetyltransferase n=1 Tax=Verrucosispora sioxanthis TaxID=2499994 RepID=UPI001C0FB9DF|nr:acetyltransferase [Verrucosispora sioxanthis]